MWETVERISTRIKFGDGYISVKIRTVAPESAFSTWDRPRQRRTGTLSFTRLDGNQEQFSDFHQLCDFMRRENAQYLEFIDQQSERFATLICNFIDWGSYPQDSDECAKIQASIGGQDCRAKFEDGKLSFCVADFLDLENPAVVRITADFKSGQIEHEVCGKYPL